ncbi:MAG: hypothetical protein NXI32_11805 [bacterium]|nr:hypothetical protein [bacterium]
MSEEKSTLDSLVDLLKQERDELRLKMHLAEMDARDEYDRLSGKVDQLSDQFEPVKNALDETGKGIYAALGLLADELKVGFDRVRKAVIED